MRPMPRPKVLPLFLAALAAGCAGGDGGDTAADTGPATFVATLGADTIWLEEFSRTETRIEGQLIERNPSTHKVVYAADLGADGRITRLEAEMLTPNADGAWDSQAWTVEMGDESATVAVAGEEPIEVPVGASAIPTLGRTTTAMFVYEQAMRMATAAGGGELPVEFVSTRPQPTPNAVTPMAGDTVSFSFFGNPMKVWAAGGNVQGVSGTETTMKQEVRMASTALDLDALANEYAARDAAGEGLGTPSPAATMLGRVGASEVEIRYSQPAKRGRDIWGGLVPEGTVWRTGANAATHFSTPIDVMIGDLAVPAGTYTLWSVYEGGQETLIVNRQTQQWGTQYDEAQDLGRVAMTRSELDAPLERFTFSLEDGMLSMAWDTSRFSVPISAR